MEVGKRDAGGRVEGAGGVGRVEGESRGGLIQRLVAEWRFGQEDANTYEVAMVVVAGSVR